MFTLSTYITVTRSAPATVYSLVSIPFCPPSSMNLEIDPFGFGYQHFSTGCIPNVPHWFVPPVDTGHGNYLADTIVV